MSLFFSSAEERELNERAESNPLIWFPAQMLAVGGSLTISADPNLVPKENGYNIRTKNGLGGVLQVRDWIDDAYQFYFDILEDPMCAAQDELLNADEYDFLIECPKDMPPCGEEYRKWEICQILNRQPKVTDSKRLRVATFIVSLLDYEDLCKRLPDEIYTNSKWYAIYDSLHRHWRITLSKLLDFAVETAKRPNAENNIGAMLQCLIDGQKKHDAKLDALADKAKDLTDELAQWRKWVARLTKPGKHMDAPKLAAAPQEAVVRTWAAYAEECKSKHKRPSPQGCLDEHGADEIYKSAATGKAYQLLDLATDEKTLKAIVHNAQARQSARNKKADSGEKSNPRQKREGK